MREVPTQALGRPTSFLVDGREFLRLDIDGRSGPPVRLAVAKDLGGRYDVEEVLGIGEVTFLLRARDRRTGQPVVIKALRSDVLRAIPPSPDRTVALVAEIRGLRHMLQAERRLLVRLRNAGCGGVPIPLDYAYDVDPELAEIGASSVDTFDPFLPRTQPYLVLGYVAGTTLEGLIEAEFPSGMDEERALRWMWPIARTLAVLHEPWHHPGGRTWHCVFQDLKPANVMIDPLGRPTLLDFGGCQVVVDGVPVLAGAWTPGYGPPECVGPPRVLLPCADVYTIGSTLFHMLTGIDPRHGSERRRSAGEAAIDLGRLPSGCSEGIRQLLARCLAPRPSERLADASHAADAIAALLPP